MVAGRLVQGSTMNNVGEVRARRSAKPTGAGKVVTSMMRKRSRVTFTPVAFVTLVRKESVPKVELFAGSLVKSRTRLGGEPELTHGKILLPGICALRWTGEVEFSGPGAPRR